MQITEVKVLPVNGDERLKAFVSIKLDACFVVRDMKIIAGNNGLFVAMPAKKMKDGTYRDLIHPLDQQTREMVEGLVLDEYKKVTTDNVKRLSVVQDSSDKQMATV
ncbi:MAG: septation regulator SpoVG [Proteobacteria bacterium]|nr:septation regulator SpoVG [Pseudomonadota bacterium]